jgi:hypothetical protein
MHNERTTWLVKRCSEIAPLPSECHELRVEHNGQQEVVADNQSHGEHGGNDADLPVLGNDESHDDHGGRHANAESECVLELLDDIGDSLPEGDVFEFLGGSSPLHIDAEEMTEERLRDVERNTAEEDGQERDPLEVGEQSADEASLTNSVTQHCKCDVTNSCENTNNGEIDLE